MKYFRKAPEAPTPEPVAEIPVAPADTSEMLAAVRALQDAAERIQSPRVSVTVPEAKPAPKAFTVTVTKRDDRGRVLEFDVRAAEDVIEDGLEAGFSEIKLQ